MSDDKQAANVVVDDQDFGRHGDPPQNKVSASASLIKIVVVSGLILTCFTIVAIFLNGLVSGAPGLTLILILPLAWGTIKLANRIGHYYDKLVQ